MASSNHDFDDQTDEDFFDKLVDGEFDDPELKAKEISRDLSNLSLESDFSKSLESTDAIKNDCLNLTKSNSEIEIGVKSNSPTQNRVEGIQRGAFSVDSLNESKKSSTFDCLSFSAENPDVFEESLAENINSKHENLKSHDTERDDSLVINSNYSKLETGAKSGLSKPTSVKEVQWGAFCGDSLDEIEKYPIYDYSGFSAEDVNGGFVESTVDASSNVGLVEQHYNSATERLNNNDLILEKSAFADSNGVNADTKSNASKGTSVKEVKWSDFNADSSQEIENSYGFNSFEPFSASSVENSNEFIDKFSLSASSSDRQYDYSSTGEYTVDQNDPQYWEKLYPGWKFDSSSGQWYQVDNNIATTNTQLDNSNVAVADSVFVNSDASYNMHQPSLSVLETVNEGNIASSNINFNNDSQGIVNYPPHMVFDPQYPGWYYDTNTQEWYTLESYGHRVNDNSNPLQDLSSEQNNSLYSKAQEEGTQKFGQSWDASLSNYNQKNDSDDNISQSQQTICKDLGSQETSQWNAFTSNYDEQNHLSSTTNQFEKQIDQNKANAQQSMWPPQPLNSHKQDGYQATVNFSQQSFNGANAHDQFEKQINQNITRDTNAQQSMWQPQPLNSRKQDGYQSTINFSQQSFNGANAHDQFEKQINQNITRETNAQQSVWQPQPLKNHIGDANLLKSNYTTTSSYPLQSSNGATTHIQSQKHANQNIVSIADAQQSIWQPQPLKSHIEDADLSMINYGDQATMSYSQQSFTGANACDQSEKQIDLNISGKTYAQQSPWQHQLLESHNGDANLSKSNYGDQAMSYPPQSFTGANVNGQSEKQTDQNIASITYAQQSMCQPQPLNSHINDANLSKSNNDDQPTINYSQQFHNGSNVYNFQLSNAPIDGRSSAGRPPHALITFGFGGKLLIMKEASFAGGNLDSGNQVSGSSAISVLNLHEFVTEKSDYFNALCQSSYPGPLVGGSAASKDVNKWVDEKIVKCESSTIDFQDAKSMKMLYSLLKITCQHYGKLRSSFGADLPLETDGPDAAVTKLFASAKTDGTHLTEFGSLTHCALNIPSEGQIQATTIEVQKLLVSGRKKEALQYAQDGQLWGPALVIASQLGDNFYVDTVTKMAECQFASGTPLRTLCLLIAGKPTDVFSNNSYPNSFHGAAMGNYGSTQVPARSILDSWEENLAIICANRTKDDELVIIHLGDCLYKDRMEIIPAHVCYLLAEANFESYSDSARLCLIGADHWKCPRTYATPEAIQRTEVYEYSKVLGNSQFVLLPLQPYKLVYAHMLAEVGRVSDSLRYCQSLQKSLKNPGQAPEIEIWKSTLSSLEERLRTHQQGGYSSNLAPAKLVGKLFNSLDRSITRIIGSPPPNLPPVPQTSANSKEFFFKPVSKVASSQSVMDVASLIPSASVETMSQWSNSGNTVSTHSRSISEPEVVQSSVPKPSKDATPAKVQSNSSDTSSKFGRIGSQLFQKTFGWVSKSRQAKLGESNKFHYDEKLKRWVEEGAEPPAEEITPPPPPPKAPTFQNGASDYNISSAFKDNIPPSNGIMEQKPPGSSELNLGTPPIPPTQNQFSARGRMGVRSRYVDTFNKGASNPSGGTIKSSFQPPIAPSIKPAINTKFFVPTAPASANDIQQNDTIKHVTQESTANTEPSMDNIPPYTKEMTFSPPPSSSSSSSTNEMTFLPPPSSSSSSSTNEMTFLPLPSSSLQKFPSMDNIPPYTRAAPYNRAVSWSGVYSNISAASSSSDGGVLGDELQEVEL